MTTGTGIAIAGIWIGIAIVACSPVGPAVLWLGFLATFATIAIAVSDDDEGD